jgi:hypothetical protein
MENELGRTRLDGIPWVDEGSKVPELEKSEGVHLMTSERAWAGETSTNLKWVGVTRWVGDEECERAGMFDDETVRVGTRWRRTRVPAGERKIGVKIQRKLNTYLPSEFLCQLRGIIQPRKALIIDLHVFILLLTSIHVALITVVIVPVSLVVVPVAIVVVPMAVVGVTVLTWPFGVVAWYVCWGRLVCWQSRFLGVCGEFWMSLLVGQVSKVMVLRLTGSLVEDVVDEGVQDGHGLVGDTNIGCLDGGPLRLKGTLAGLTRVLCWQWKRVWVPFRRVGRRGGREVLSS